MHMRIKLQDEVCTIIDEINADQNEKLKAKHRHVINFGEKHKLKINTASAV